MRIDQRPEPGYESAKIDYVGFLDPYAVEGVVLLKADDGREFHIRAFSGEVARQINSFLEDSRERRIGSSFSPNTPESFPTIYRMIEEICENSELVLVKVKVYDSGQALRANLYFTGKKDLVLRNYRASDALALAAFYNIPILVKKDLLREKMQV